MFPERDTEWHRVMQMEQDWEEKGIPIPAKHLIHGPVGTVCLVAQAGGLCSFRRTGLRPVPPNPKRTLPTGPCMRDGRYPWTNPPYPPVAPEPRPAKP